MCTGGQKLEPGPETNWQRSRRPSLTRNLRLIGEDGQEAESRPKTQPGLDLTCRDGMARRPRLDLRLSGGDDQETEARPESE